MQIQTSGSAFRKVNSLFLYLRRVSLARGATTVELALVVPIVITLLFAAIEFSRYSTQRALLESATQQAAAFAAIVPDLEREGGLLLFDDDQYLPTPNSASSDDLGLCNSVATASVADCRAQQKALKGVIDELYSKLEASGIALTSPTQAHGSAVTEYRLKLPERLSGDTTSLLEERMLNQPIELSLTGSFDSLIPGVTKIPLRATVLFYREPTRGATMPVPAPCLPGSCPCPNRLGDSNWVAAADGSCVCAAGPEVLDPNNDCECLKPAQEYNPATKQCACPTCTLPANSLPNGETCQCQCPTGMELNQAGTACLCSNGSQPPCCGPGLQQNCEQTEGATFNHQTCQCQCPENTHRLCEVTGRCILETVIQACEANRNALAQWGVNEDEDDCGCMCGNGWKNSADGLRCECPAPNQECTRTLANGTQRVTCVLPFQGGVDLQSNNCVNACPPGYNWCLDYSGGNVNPQFCTNVVCEDGATPGGSGGCNECTCPDSNKTYDYNNNRCVCETGFVTCSNGNCLKCTGGNTPVAQTCQCVCNLSCAAGAQPNVNCDACVCPNPNEDYYQGQCLPKCGPGQEHTGKDGACACIAGFTQCASGNSCIQCAAPRVPNTNSCQCDCPSDPCPAGRVRNPTTCGCDCSVSCPPGKVPNSDCVCVCPALCPAPKQQNPDTCECSCRECDDRNQEVVDYTTCACDCQDGTVRSPIPDYCWRPSCTPATCEFTPPQGYSDPGED